MQWGVIINGDKSIFGVELGRLLIKCNDLHNIPAALLRDE